MTHSFINVPSGLTITLDPYLAEKIDFIDSIPVSRKELLAFTNSLEDSHPGIIFDYTYMDSLEHKNLWFLDILTNNKLK